MRRAMRSVVAHRQVVPASPMLPLGTTVVAPRLSTQPSAPGARMQFQLPGRPEYDISRTRSFTPCVSMVPKVRRVPVSDRRSQEVSADH